MDKIAVLIPCLNEEKTIEKVIKDFKRVLPESIIYVYDNGSTDDSKEIAKAAGAASFSVERRGKGNVLRQMFRDIDAECYILVDGDDTYPAEDAALMADLIFNKKADMVVGDRLSSTYYKENKRRFHNLGNFLIKKTINFIFGSDIKDIMTGYRAFSYDFVKSFPVLSGGFEIETEMTIHAIDKRLEVIDIPIGYRDRPEGSKSKLHTIKDGYKVFFTIFNLYRLYKPLQFFGLLSFILTIISVSFFIPIFKEYLDTGLVARFPTLIVCGFVEVAALLSFFSGMILSEIVQKNRQDFEIEIKRIQGEYRLKKLLEKSNK